MRSFARLSTALVAAAVAVSGPVLPVREALAGPPGGTPEPSVTGRPLGPTERWEAASDESDPMWTSPPPVTPPTAGTAEVVVPASGLGRARDLPVLVGRPEHGESPARVRVTLHDPAQAAAVGAHFVLVTVERADGSPLPARVSLAIDYSNFRFAYGGDFVHRLRLVSLPGCAVEVPIVAACAVPTVLAARNDLGATQILGEVPVPDDAEHGGGTYALAAASDGQTGNFAATPLSAAAKWTVSPNTGAFSWSYPIPMPPAPAGDTPALSLDYSAQVVDGRTARANGQVSQVGEGWSFSPMFVERKFSSCREDGQAKDDLCHNNPEYYLSWNGRSSELVRISGTNEWRLRDDPTWRVRSLQGASNGDHFGDYWEVTTPGGTQHLFGYGREPVTNAVTDSAWTVPVYGDDPLEPCYTASGSASSWCTRAWRWNLDRIVDPDDNVVSLFWTKETNYYAKFGNTSAGASYVRGGHLRRIDYGERNTRENWAAPAYVTVATTNRCAAQVDCTDSTLATPSNYPDVPLDLRCTSPACPGLGQAAPSFWSVKQVSTIATWVKNNAATDSTATYSDVDEVQLYYSFPATGEDTTPSLFLRAIRRHGLVGTRVTLPDVRIGGVGLSNRVDSSPGGGVPATNKYRVNAIETELGAKTLVSYGQTNPCSATQLPPSGGWNENDTDCFPQWFDPDGPGPAAGGWGTFRKYLVTAVELDDTTVPLPASPSRITTYSYLATPEWHYDNALHVPDGPTGQQSWSDWRGYASVQVFTGSGVSRSGTLVKAFQGMHGDKATTLGGTKSRQLTDSDSASFTDHDWLAGRPLETIRYSVAGSPLEKTQYRYWSARTVSGPGTATSVQPHDAYYVRESSRITKVRNLYLPDAWRSRQVDTSYDPTYAHPLTVSDLGEVGVAWTGDETCTSNAYVVNPTKWIVGLPYVTRRYSGGCTSGTQIARTEVNYDGQAYASAPAKGNPTTVKALIDGAAAAVTTTGYDLLGRVTSVTAPNQYGTADPARTTTTFDPTSGYPYNGVTTRSGVTAALPSGVLSTFARFSFGWGVPWQATDANGHLTQVNRDALGRVLSVQRPLDPAGSPGLVVDYSVDQNVPSWIRTRTLLTSGVYVDSYAYVTSFGTPAETQTASPAGGRIVTATRYDDQGRFVARTNPMHHPDAAGSGLLNAAPEDVPSEDRAGYDALGRTTSSGRYANGVAQWTTTTTYYGIAHQVDHPVRFDVTYEYDVFGRVTDIAESASAGSVDTHYSYTPTGLLDTITDEGGNVWDYAYDWLGRRTSAKDPDQGAWATTFDRNGNAVTVTDAAGQTLWHGYDVLDRRTQTRLGNPAGTLLSHWTYDATGGNNKGRLKSATRFVGADAYTVTVTGYDQHGRPEGRTWTIPAAETGLAGSYTHAYTYDHAGNVRTVDYPAVGGLAAERVTAGVSDLGLPTTLTSDYGGGATYVRSTSYDKLGRTTGRHLGADGVQVDRAYSYEPVTARLATVTTTITGLTTPPATTDQATYRYDAEGNVTAVTTTQPDVGATVAQTECFGYDGRNQLVTAFTTNDTTCTVKNATYGFDPYDLTYTYDAIGNLTATADALAAGSARTYSHPTPGPTTVRPHAPTAVNGSAYGYDPNGAMTTRPAAGGPQTLTWDARHRLESVTDSRGTTSFGYDADGNRLIRRDPSGVPVRTLYLDDVEVRAAEGPNGVTVTATRYYGGHALRTTDSGTTTLHWLAVNHQNSAVLSVATIPGAEVKRRRYDPYGAPREAGPNGLATSRGFLNKTEDPTGLTALGARYYDPTAGIFASVDELIDVREPASFNGYAYAVRNPTTETDPTGLSNTCSDQGQCYVYPDRGTERPTTPDPTPTPWPGSPSLVTSGKPRRVTPAPRAQVAPSPPEPFDSLMFDFITWLARRPKVVFRRVICKGMHACPGPRRGGAGAEQASGGDSLPGSTHAGDPSAWLPEAATTKIPPEWGPGSPTKKGNGVRWTDPANQGNGVRIDRGDPGSQWLTQRVDHVIVRRNGLVIGRDGEPLPGSVRDYAFDAHIPLDEWMAWAEWWQP